MINNPLTNGIVIVICSLPTTNFAAQETSRFRVQVTLVASCSIESTETLDFGMLSSDAIAAGNQTDTSDIDVACSEGTSYDIGLSGKNGNRAMRSENNSIISYELYQDTGNSIDWDNESVLSATGTGSTVTHQVSGYLPGTVFVTPADNGSPGVFLSDMVTVTLTF